MTGQRSSQLFEKPPVAEVQLPNDSTEPSLLSPVGAGALWSEPSGQVRSAVGAGYDVVVSEP